MTETTLLEQIAGKQDLTLNEVKAAKSAAEENKRQYEDLTAKVNTLTSELETKGATILEMQAEVQEVKAKGGRMKGSEAKTIFIGNLIADAIAEHKADIITTKLIQTPLQLIQTEEQKAVANMSSANLTGVGNNYVSYLDWQPGMEPTGQFRFRSLVRTIQSDTDFVRFPRAKKPIGEGSFARVNEGQTKPQIDRDYEMIDLTLKAFAGYAIVSRQSLRNIKFLQSWLPTSMMEQLSDQEDLYFAETLIATATGNASTAGMTDGTSTIGRLVAYIRNAGIGKYRVTGIAMANDVWANLITNQVTGAGYNLPNIVTVTVDGTVRILGIPVYPVNWLGAGRVIAGDWSKAAIIQSEGLVMRQSDSHANIFTSNELAFLLERTEELAIFRPDAFITSIFS